MAKRESRLLAELLKLRADVVTRLELIDVRSESLGPALREIVQHAERTIRRLAQARRP
jgi:hypothetical protein